MRSIASRFIRSGRRAYRSRSLWGWPWVLPWLFAASVLEAYAPQSAVVLSLERSASVPVDELSVVGNRAQHWRNRLGAVGIQAEIAGSEALDLSLFDYDIVILPGASRALDVVETDLLSDYVAAGGSLVLTERAGGLSRGGDQSDSLARRLGLEYRDDLFGKTDSWLAVMDQPCVLSARLSRMQNFDIQSLNPVFIESANEPVAFWLDYRVSPPNYEEASRMTAMTYGYFGRGRFFWMGFPIDGLGADLESSESFFRLFGNLSDFFARLPIAELAPWPAPYKVAAFFSMDVEQQFGNIRRVFALENLPPFTHFILTNQGELYEEILAEISAYQGADQEISLHGDNHDLFRGQDRQIQYERFQRAKESIVRITGIPPSGFRPPQELYDFFTVESLLRNGYTYMLADSNPRASVPKISREWAQPRFMGAGDEVMVQLNIHNKDDVKILNKNNFPSPDFAFQEYVQDFENIRLREGLYAANTHSHLLASERYIGVFQRFLDHVRSFNPWFANGRQIADWWRKRDRILLTHFRRNSHNIIFGVENNSGTSVENLLVDIWLPYAPASVATEVRPMIGRSLEYELEGNRLRLFLDDLETDAVREYHVSWRDSN